MRRWPHLLSALLLAAVMALPASAASPASAPAVPASASALSPAQRLTAPRSEATSTASSFHVSDEQGVLLTCQPRPAHPGEFDGCTLAPGRTLEDLVRAMVAALHAEQAQHDRDRAAWLRQIEAMMDQKLGLTASK